MRGRQHFNQKWVIFPSMGGDWGLGPTFIADKCSGCHIGAFEGEIAGRQGRIRRLSVGKDEPGSRQGDNNKNVPDFGAV